MQGNQFNECVVQKEVSIVTDIPGTTRDVVREDALIEGITFRILDTAGTRKQRTKLRRKGSKELYLNWSERTSY